MNIVEYFEIENNAIHMELLTINYQKLTKLILLKNERFYEYKIFL